MISHCDLFLALTLHIACTDFNCLVSKNQSLLLMKNMVVKIWLNAAFMRHFKATFIQFNLIKWKNCFVKANNHPRIPAVSQNFIYYKFFLLYFSQQIYPDTSCRRDFFRQFRYLNNMKTIIKMSIVLPKSVIENLLFQLIEAYVLTASPSHFTSYRTKYFSVSQLLSI